jgi:cytochrome c553
VTIKITWTRALLAIALLATLGMTVAWLGIINIGASTGHWTITDKFLHWTMRNAVRTQATLTVAEPASDPSGLVSAAGHYASTCAFCHGAPGEPLPPMMQAATPPAPSLLDTAHEWTDPQLFWIVKHGVKFTAMPAWIDMQRDDEVRRMVALVRRLPEMSPAQYRSLAYGAAGTRVVAGRSLTLGEALPDCARCHGFDGRGRGQPDIPILGGQRPESLLASLSGYASGHRGSGVMQSAAMRVSPEAMRALALHYAAQPGLASASAPPPLATSDLDRLAAQVVARGLPEENLPACASCHSTTGRRVYPVLAGQRADYLAQRLRIWRQGEAIEARQPNEPMPVIARRIPEDLIEPLAAYFARQR